jgi:hypothetical protein
MRRRASVRIDGPLEPAIGNAYQVVITTEEGRHILNPCTLQVAIGFAERWNAKSNTETASVRYCGDVGSEP